MAANSGIQKGKRNGMRGKTDIELKTPSSLLNEICSNASANLSVRVGPIKSPVKGLENLFQCDMEVVNKFGNLYRSSGIGRSKPAAKQCAARNLLMKMAPGCASMLEPELGILPPELEEVYGDGNLKPLESDLPNKLNEIQNQEAISGQLEGNNEVEENPEPKFNSQQAIQVSAKNLGNKLEVTLLVPNSGVQPFASLPTLEKVEMMKAWDGPKISKLRGLTLSEIIKAPDPIRIARKVTSEQNMRVESIHVQEMNIHHCFLEVYPVMSSENQEKPQVLFSTFGTGSTAENAEQTAASHLIQMLRLLLVVE